jgi:hypothetical protein
MQALHVLLLAFCTCFCAQPSETFSCTPPSARQSNGHEKDLTSSCSKVSAGGCAESDLSPPSRCRRVHTQSVTWCLLAAAGLGLCSQLLSCILDMAELAKSKEAYKVPGPAASRAAAGEPRCDSEVTHDNPESCASAAWSFVLVLLPRGQTCIQPSGAAPPLLCALSPTNSRCSSSRQQATSTTRTGTPCARPACASDAAAQKH